MPNKANFKGLGTGKGKRVAQNKANLQEGGMSGNCRYGKGL